MKAATDTKKYLLEHTKREEGAYAVLGPTPCPLLRANNYFRWQLCLKCRINQPVRQAVKTIMQKMTDSKDKVFLNIYVNPENLI